MSDISINSSGIYKGGTRVCNPYRVNGVAYVKGVCCYRIVGTHIDAWINPETHAWECRGLRSFLERGCRVSDMPVTHWDRRPSKRLVVIDGPNLTHRAFYAVPNLTTRDGRPTGAIKGFLNQIMAIKDYNPSASLVVAWDPPRSTSFRRAMYPEYKANRSTTPEELVPQFKPIEELVALLGTPGVLVPTLEADDVIATIVTHHAMTFGCQIYSSDKDLAQLVSKRVTMYHPGAKTLMYADDVFQKWGVRPDQMHDYLVLLGDKSDNIPGVPGCGEKTAATWINKYGCLAGVIENANVITGKVGENLRNHLNKFDTTDALVRLCISDKVPELRFTDINFNGLRNFCERFELAYPYES